MAREHFDRKTMVPATSPALLLLCGDMRGYRLLETPLDAHLEVCVRVCVRARVYVCVWVCLGLFVCFECCLPPILDAPMYTFQLTRARQPGLLTQEEDRSAKGPFFFSIFGCVCTGCVHISTTDLLLRLRSLHVFLLICN